MEIRKLGAKDARAYALHLTRHFNESFDEGLIFHPYSEVPEFGTREKLEKMRKGWAKSLEQAGWERVWGAWDGDRLVGHVDVHPSPIPMVTHRCCLGLGLESTHRRQGLGRLLVQEALKWAREQGPLDWMDLNVFSHNRPALMLYEKLGFVVNGDVKDQFRVRGQSIDDISMALRLR